MKMIHNRTQLEALTTPRLLAYKASLMKVPEKANWDGEKFGRGYINKSQSSWQDVLNLVKTVLATRENIS